MDVMQKAALVKKMCNDHRNGCDGCIYSTKAYGCRVKDLIYEMVKTAPCNWDLEYMRKLINGCD